jgi:drug/metabolite transporter (DMT)-like permease
VIQYTNPVWTALIAAVVLGEWIGRAQVGLALLSLAGVVLVARPGFLTGGGSALDPVAVAVALVGALFSAGAYVTVRRLRGEEPMVVVFHFALVSTLGCCRRWRSRRSCRAGRSGSCSWRSGSPPTWVRSS